MNQVKSENADKNANALVDMLGLLYAVQLGGGTNDNASDAQKEIRITFEKIMTMVKGSDQFTEEEVHNILYENDVLRKAIAFDDPYHIANLCVTWASIYAFGEVVVNKNFIVRLVS